MADMFLVASAISVLSLMAYVIISNITKGLVFLIKNPREAFENVFNTILSILGVFLSLEAILLALLLAGMGAMSESEALCGFGLCYAGAVICILLIISGLIRMIDVVVSKFFRRSRT